VSEDVPPVPRERQTIRLPPERLRSLRPWAVDGTGRAAAARVRDEDGRIALVRNGWTDGWFLPGGAVEPGETPAEAVEREVREETGLDATVTAPLVVLDQSYVSERGGTEWFTAEYVAFAARAEGAIPDPARLGTSDDEIEAARWFETLPSNLHDRDLLRPYL